MDVFDRASEKEERDRTDAIATVLEAARPTSLATGTCVDCGEPIEPERLAVMQYAQRCISCQRQQEHRNQVMTGGRRA
ncbi:TraR/DksA C4-type zinc finger protein [Shewanella yunxiaonensis]|uniref:TraR/DksA C4-type zinc finger protein n=1 Tax=Shewanella yunxiaonensis TaxID=2829809 RepID=A0ABX7YUK6_9GAMM|nr:TraR/DksA C4-type zinc finger protein [Shewanella yunxiaonensis]QUN06444.1 TraR/DksA C4-type zinc finger protein [Shewanella yunxiaonensis]